MIRNYLRYAQKKVQRSDPSNSEIQNYTTKKKINKI